MMIYPVTQTKGPSRITVLLDNLGRVLVLALLVGGCLYGAYHLINYGLGKEVARRDR